jgi:hypothetical protein
VGLLAFAYRYLSYAGFPNDHFVHLATAQQMTMGAMPVRDYVERGLPLMSAVSAVAQLALGEGLHSELLLVAAAYGLAAAWTFLVAAYAGRSITVGLIAAAATVLAYPVSYSYPKVLVYAGAFLGAAWYAASPRIGRLALLAAAVVAAFLFRHDHGVFLAAGSMALLLVLFGTSRKAVSAAAAFAIFVILFAAPYLAWAHANGGLDAYVGDGIAFSRREAERSMRIERPAFGIDRTRPLFTTLSGGPIVNIRWQPDIRDDELLAGERAHRLTRLDPVGERTWQYRLGRWSSSALERLVRDPAVADTHGIDRSRYRLTDADPGFMGGLFVGMPLPAEGLRLEANALAGLYYLAWLVPIAVVFLLVASRHRIPPAIRGLAGMAVLVQMAMNASMLRDPLILRIRDVIVPLALLLAFIAGAAAMASGRMLRWTGRLAAVGLLLIAAGLSAIVGQAPEHMAEARLLDGGRGVAERRAELRNEFRSPRERTGTISDAYGHVVSYLRSCTDPDARILALTFAPELFFYARRGFAGGLVTLTPGTYVTARHASLMMDRLSREDVPLVVLDTETEQEVRRGYPRIAEHLAAMYHTIASFPVSGDKRFIVLAENSRTPVREYGPERLPCFAAIVESGLTRTDVREKPDPAREG